MQEIGYKKRQKQFKALRASYGILMRVENNGKFVLKKLNPNILNFKKK
jgi:hypothetical protein